MRVRIDGNMASATKRAVVRVTAKHSNLVRTIFAVLIAGWLGQPALAQTLPNPSGLTEADIAPCNELLSYRGALFSDPTDLSNLDFALSTTPYKPLYDIESTRIGLEHSAESVEIMEARDEERMRSIIGKVYRGQDYVDRLNSDRTFSCMLDVRLGQLTGKKPVAKPTAKPLAATGDKAFQSNLSTFAADQLFAMANDFVQRGELGMAKLARNALLARFPDSPLVPAIVQLLTSTTQPAARVAAQPVAPIAAPRVAATPTSQTNSQRVYLNDGASVIAAFARFGVVLTQVPNSKALQHDKNQFSAYASDCDASRCKAIRLITVYVMTPSLERINAWNDGRLYGRAGLGDGIVSYDTVVPIPSTGIDINDLKEVVDSHLARQDFFLAEMTKP